MEARERQARHAIDASFTFASQRQRLFKAKMACVRPPECGGRNAGAKSISAKRLTALKNNSSSRVMYARLRNASICKRKPKRASTLDLQREDVQRLGGESRAQREIFRSRRHTNCELSRNKAIAASDTAHVFYFVASARQTAFCAISRRSTFNANPSARHRLKRALHARGATCRVVPRQKRAPLAKPRSRDKIPVAAP